MTSAHNIIEYIKFINIKDFIIDLNAPGKILVEYTVSEKAIISNKDWVAIFPHDSDIQNLELLVTYEFVLARPVNKDGTRFELQFNLKGVKNLIYGQQYHFVYFSRYSEIYGVSDEFTFSEPTLEETLKIPQLLSMNNNNNDTYESKMNTNAGRHINRRKSQIFVKAKSEKPESEDKGGSGDHPKLESSDFITRFVKNKQRFDNAIQKIETPRSTNHLITTNFASPPVSCSNCQRVGTLLKIQNELYTNIKNLAEENSEQNNLIVKLKNQLELQQAAYQKLSVTLMQHHPQTFICERSKFKNKYEVKDTYITNENMPRYFRCNRYAIGEKVKNELSVVKLKAIIGNQEQKIRLLTEKNIEMQKEIRNNIRNN